MGLVITATFAVALWVVLFALDVKSFDGFLLALVIVLIGAVTRILSQTLPGARGED